MTSGRNRGRRPNRDALSQRPVPRCATQQRKLLTEVPGDVAITGGGELDNGPLEALRQPVVGGIERTADRQAQRSFDGTQQIPPA